VKHAFVKHAVVKHAVVKHAVMKHECRQSPCRAADIQLRALRDDDLVAFLAYRGDPEVARYQGWWPMDEAKARTFLREQGARDASPDTRRWVQFAIAEASTDALLGDLGVWMLQDGTEAEIGITVAPAAQGRSIGRNAVRAALAMLFADPAVVRIRADADSRNAACRRMLVAAGFREAGTADVFVKEMPCVEHRYIVERDWFAPVPEGEMQ
jgi:RimJ/RimL family protein N-acetyltransferase